MIDIGDFSINRRSKDRVKTKLNAQYFIKKKSAQYLECRVVDLSRTGAGVSIPPNERPECGNIMFIDIYIPKTLSRVSMQGEIKRIEKREKELICGIKFSEMVTQAVFAQLIK